MATKYVSGLPREFQLTSQKKKEKRKVAACRRGALFSGGWEAFIETFLRLFQFVFKCGCTVTAPPVLIFRASTAPWKRTGRTQSLIYVLTKYIKRRRRAAEFTESPAPTRRGNDLTRVILFRDIF